MKALLRALADNGAPRSLANKMRRKRFGLFRALLHRCPAPIRVLDIGGTESFWQMMGLLPDERLSIVLLNTYEQTPSLAGFQAVVGDGRALRFADKEFDIVFSNSVIEHVGGFVEQVQFANEAQRVGKRYFIQTPNKYFPLEPHYLFPFFQFLPLQLRAALISRFSLGWGTRAVSYAAALGEAASIRLLTRAELVRLFPGATMHEEKFGLLTKSFIAAGGFEK